MPKRTKPELLDIIIRSIAEGGWNIFYLDATSRHPFRIQIYREDEYYPVRIYIWNLTHGGGAARPINEYRIQITGLNTSSFEVEIGGKTLILGWWDEAEVFAGFDYNKHSGTLGASPSIQIREENLSNAHLNGFSPCYKGNQEIAIAFRPDFFVEYVINLEFLHSFGDSESDLSILQAVAENSQAINDTEILRASETRQTTLVSVRKRLRDASFRARVLTAYGHRCAVCGVQLNLVEAAHIVPVSHEQGTDATSNGVALCVLHHRAYDLGLIYINENYYVAVNENQVSNIRTIARDGGIDGFIQALRAMIILPPSIADRPHREYLCLANSLRISA